MSRGLPIASRLSRLPGYAFDELDRLRVQRVAEGADVIDFGVGDPTEPVPQSVIDAAAAGLVRHRRSGYPSYVGAAGFRAAAARFLERRHGILLDPDSQVTVSVGSKEAVFHLPLAFVDPGDLVLVPSPGYPPYVTGTLFAGGRVRAYAVRESGPLLPDLDELPLAESEALRVVWITQPHVPTGRVADREALGRLYAQCRERGVLLCSDEAYSEVWFREPPASALEAGVEGVLVFQSLSKQAAMTGYRIGFVAGDPEASASFRRLKTQIDSGAPDFVQDAGVVALDEPQHAAAARTAYRERAEILLPALRALGCRVEEPEAGLYLWARVPGDDGVAFARELLGGPAALAVMPGEWLAHEVPGESHPGQGRVRLALVPDSARCAEAAARLSP